MSNVTIIQFGHQNARSGRNRVFPIRIPINTIWSGWSFLGHHSCNKSSTSPSRARLSMLELDVPFWILLELLCLRMSKSFLLESRRWSKDVVFHFEYRVNRMVYPTLTNPPDIYIQFGEKFRGTDTNGMIGKTRCRIPVRTTLQNASTQR